ncbi:DegT/DnrJ/EryC1/StrS family aminotransferase [bacterium]|nr:DegT/DnrJ/EryC1/StrS family aminotransferase [bacterium]
MIPIAKPVFDDEMISAASNILKSGMVVQGKKVEEFEERFANYIGVKYAVAVSNGTSALHTAILSYNIKSGDEVIVPSFSFIATANSVMMCGAKPVFSDVGEDFCIDIEDVKEKITPKTKAIMPVHLYGQPCDMKAIMDIVEDHKLILIEDAAQAHGAEFAGKRVGSFGTGCFSFYATKNMTTIEGGMITTDDKNVYERAKLIRNHGMPERYVHAVFGYNYRMTDVQAAIGLLQLKRLDEWNNTRIKNAELLTSLLSDIEGIITPKRYPKRKHVFHQYTIRITPEFRTTREKLIEELRTNNIGSIIYYPIPIHKQKLYQDLGFDISLPKTEKIAKEVLSLPVHQSVKKEDLEKIANVVRG